jgi:hypothetical protein
MDAKFSSCFPRLDADNPTFLLFSETGKQFLRNREPIAQEQERIRITGPVSSVWVKSTIGRERAVSFGPRHCESCRSFSSFANVRIRPIADIAGPCSEVVGVVKEADIRCDLEAVVDRLRRAPRNFRAYGGMEAGNILLLPGLVLFFAPPHRPAEVLAAALAVASASSFLLVGTFYWRALDRRITRADHKSINKALAFADRVEIPFLVLTAISTLWLMFALSLHGWSSALVAAAILTLLGGLEYVNYYHLQLQNFDRWSDFRRLFLTGRLRRAHMSRALATQRETDLAPIRDLRPRRAEGPWRQCPVSTHCGL